MMSVGDTICRRIKDSVEKGNLPQLKALAQQFPTSFESFRNAETKNNLVDSAWRHRHDAMVIYLIMEHGFEVSSECETQHNTYGRQTLGENCYFSTNEEEVRAGRYFKTCEALANAMLGVKPADDSTCGALKTWAEKGALPGWAEQYTLNKEFIQQAVSGQFAKFLKEKLVDERAAPLDYTHGVKMLKAMSDNIEQLESKCREVHAAVMDSGKDVAKDRGGLTFP